MSEIDNLKEELAKKDRTIRILKAEIENLKRNLEQQSNELLQNRIKFLENELNIKDKEISDLKSSIPKNKDDQEIQAKFIILQSKLRKSNEEIENLKVMLKEYELKNKRLEEQLKNQESNEKLKIEIENYQKKISQLNAKISELEPLASKAKSLEQQVLSLQKELTSKSKVGGDLGAFKDAEDINKLKSIINEQNNRIKELEENLLKSGGPSPVMGFMAQNQAQRKIKELESQVFMLKKSETEMRRKYEDLLRKIADKEEFAEY